MSNLTQLQANNQSLQACINKANSLPDAGSGGGGGSIETCTVTFSIGMVWDVSMEMYTPGALRVMAVTVEGNEMTLRDHMSPASAVRNGGTLTVAKNSLISFVARDIGSTAVASSITVSNNVPSSIIGSYIFGASFMITSDCTITVAFE